MTVPGNENLTTLLGWLEEGQREIWVLQSVGAARAFFLAGLLVEVRRPSLVLLPTAKEAARFYRELEFFLPVQSARGEPDERRLFDFPVYDLSPLSGLSPHKDVVSRRIQALYALMSR